MAASLTDDLLYRARIKEISLKGMGLGSFEHILGWQEDLHLALDDTLAPIITVSAAEAVLQCESLHLRCIHSYHCLRV